MTDFHSISCHHSHGKYCDRSTTDIKIPVQKNASYKQDMENLSVLQRFSVDTYISEVARLNFYG